MTTVAEIMSTDVQAIEPQETLQRAAQLMKELDVGSLPVCEGERLLGMVTDRDIAVRGVAAGLGPSDACVSDVMSDEPVVCRGNEDAQDVLQLMGDRQVRRLPVVDDQQKLIGIVAMSDLARRQSGHIDEAVREISAPGGRTSQ
jgi:CBS domain-containing protein